MPEIKMNQEATIIQLPYRDWSSTSPSSIDVVAALEQGKVLFFPHLAFNLTDAEKTLLSPELVDPKRKNIRYQPEQQKLTGVAVEDKCEAVQKLLARHHRACQELVISVLP